MRSDSLPTGGEWISLPLGEVASITLGGTPSTLVPGYWNGQIPWMASGEVHRGHVFEVDGRITESGLASSNATLVSPPAVAMALAGQGKTRGTVAIVHIALCTNQSIALIKGASGALDTAYLFHNLTSRYEEMRARSSGGGRGGLSRTVLRSVPIDLPPVAEQLKIAEILDSLDRSIQKAELLIEKLKLAKQGLLHDLLTRGIDDHGELRDPIRHPEQLKNSPLGLIPGHWSVQRVENLLAPVVPAMRSGPFGSALLKSELVEDGIPLIGIDNVHEERFSAVYDRFVSPTKATELARYRVRASDVMITIMGTVGRCCVAPADIGDAISTKHVWTITLNQERYSPTLMCMQINHASWVKRQFLRDSQGGIMSAISSSTLRSLLLPVPSPIEAKEIERILVTLHSRLTCAVENVAKLRLLKQGLMDDLLTGRVRVTPLLDKDSAP